MSRVERKKDTRFHAFFNTTTPVYSPADWDLAVSYAESLTDPSKFAPPERETFYPEDLRFMELRNAFLAGMVHGRSPTQGAESRD